MRNIQGLPTEWKTTKGEVIDLSLVPDGPSSELDPQRLMKVRKWSEWRDEIQRYRAYIRMAAEREPRLQAFEKEKCRRSPSLYFPTVYGWIFEPRANGLLPAIPYPFQVDFVQWMDARAVGKGADANGLVSKSRDMGATWWACLRGLGKFLFDDTYILKLISRKEDLVDDPGNMDSMMERMLVNIEMIPAYLRPSNWNRKAHKQKNKIIRPDNKNAVLGESTSAKTGRGGRSTEGYVDESALIDGLLNLNGSLMQTVGHLYNISSEYLGVSDEFVTLREALEQQYPDSVFIMDYWMHPAHDEEWLEDQHQKYINNEAGFQAEVLRNPYGGYDEWLYPMAKDIQVLPEYQPYLQGAPLDVLIDPGFDDACALHWIMHNPATGRDLVLESFESSHLPPEFYAAIILGCDLHHHPEFGLSPKEIERYNLVTAWTRTLPQVTIWGDPAGSQKHTGQSWYERMELFSAKHNPRKKDGEPISLTILYSWDSRDRHFHGREGQGRRTAMMNWLPKLDFNNTDEVKTTLLAVQKSRFEPAKDRMSEQKIPVHNWASHRRTALEYGAVNLDYSRAVAEFDLTPYIPGNSNDQDRAAD